MKFGCCLNMVASTEDGIGLEKINVIAKLGYDYVELPAVQMMALSDQEFGVLMETVKKSGIKCETSNNLFPTDFRLTGDNVDKNMILEYADKSLARLNMLGAEFAVFGSGPAKSVPEGFSVEKGYDQLVELTKELGDIAKTHSVVIVIEPLRKEESNLINSFKEGVDLAKAVDHPNIKVLVDYYHLTEENEPIANVEKWGKDYLRHVHFAQQEGRLYPTDLCKDRERYIEFFSALKKADYNSRVSVEAYTDNFEKDAGASLKMLREIIALV